MSRSTEATASAIGKALGEFVLKREAELIVDFICDELYSHDFFWQLKFYNMIMKATDYE